MDVRKSFANRRQEAPVFTKRGKLGCAYEHGCRFASLKNNDGVASIMHASHELFGSL